jgi:hypothetical protein
MGLIGGLLTLPLAPVRGTVLIARALEREAQREAADYRTEQAQLAGLEAKHDRGELSGDELEAAQDELLEHIMASRGLPPAQDDGRG